VIALVPAVVRALVALVGIYECQEQAPDLDGVVADTFRDERLRVLHARTQRGRKTSAISAKTTRTGSPITIDTAGSNFDTLIAAYLPTDPGYEEIACIDDVPFEPIGATFQAALTLDTEKGQTYYVQIGGYDFPFDEEVIGQKGRLRIAVR